MKKEQVNIYIGDIDRFSLELIHNSEYRIIGYTTVSNKKVLVFEGPNGGKYRFSDGGNKIKPKLENVYNCNVSIVNSKITTQKKINPKT